MSDIVREVVIRTATPEDVDAVVAVGHGTWPATYEPIAGADYVAMGLAKWWSRDACLRTIEQGRTTVATVDGSVVAVAVAGPLEGDLVLWKLYVLPAYQGLRIGHRLIESVIGAATTDGYPRIRLSHIDGNEKAHRFYLGHGFVDDRRETEGRGIPDAMWMVRDLPTGDHPKGELP
ncbi:putative Acetyltransferase [Nostocoides japonicum T1-X7]|uniref:Putative Acetyltransferase n=1 Tax=Nostocoides japonicum T1-X7 TaxID=1194083 RepID=A0A077LW34_9MICO|nr:GNAT family N-acetyltransferase [Tetrasphaera japonica]CCH77032.1 putative Acetyltransferase [Tetrasphaera japonica T1-X7]